MKGVDKTETKTALGVLSLVLVTLGFTAFTPFEFSSVLWRQLGLAYQSTALEMRFDPYFGRVLASGQKNTVSSTDYRFTFSTDDQGRRVTPVSPNPAADQVAFLGSSWTFGAGVDDEETFAYRAGTLLGPQYQVWNLGHVSFALQERFRKLQELLYVDRAQRLRYVFMEWLPGDARNLIRRTRWDPADFTFPANLEPRKRTRLAPEKLQSLLLMARESCERKGIGFAVLLLSRNGNDWRVPEGAYVEMKEFLTRSQIAFLDVTDIDVDRKPFVHDPHPGPRWHARVAERIAEFISRQKVR